jgi:hypothetical protein
MHKTYRWQHEEGTGLEHLDLNLTPGGAVASGLIIGNRFGAEYGLSYSIGCDKEWRVRTLKVQLAGFGALELRGDGNGQWRSANGSELKALEGCLDIDISASAFTNTLPIRRLRDELDQRHIISVVYIKIPTLTFETVAQAYTKVGAGLYRYESLSSQFEAVLEVDDDGVVVNYPGLFSRI